MRRGHAAVLATIAALIGLAAPPTARAEVATSVDVELSTTLPLPRWSDTTALGFGGALRVRVPLRGEMEAMVCLGAIGHVPATFNRLGVPVERSLLQLPLTFGVRYPISAPARVRAVIGAELGVAWSREWVRAAGEHQVDSELAAVAALSAGVAIGRVTLMTSLCFADVAARDDHLGVMFTIGGTLRRPR